MKPKLALNLIDTLQPYPTKHQDYSHVSPCLASVLIFFLMVSRTLASNSLTPLVENDFEFLSSPTS